MIGDIPGYPGEVWYNPKGNANILSMANVKKYYQITYDSSQGDRFIVHKTDENPVRVEENSDDNTSQSDGSKGNEEEPRNVEFHYVFNAALLSDAGEPESITEALQGNNRLTWIEAIKKEIENFLKRKAWKKVGKQILAKGQRPISTKWVFKINNELDGSLRYQARLCVRGFVQVPGIDFTLIHSSVATDVSIKILLESLSTLKMTAGKLSCLILKQPSWRPAWMRVHLFNGLRVWSSLVLSMRRKHTTLVRSLRRQCTVPCRLPRHSGKKMRSI